jgi:ABC-type nitrate/sulfonate/bicarbonate transport system substrate-binding protein
MARTQTLPTHTLPTDTLPTEVYEITFTRCAVRTAKGIAADLGWLHDEFAAEGIEVSSLQDAPAAGAATATARDRHRGLRADFREAGSVPALWARSRGASTRLVGLTWVDERQVILARADDGYASAADLRGRRVGIPRRRDLGVDFRQAMALHGFAGALSIAGLGLSDVQLVEVDAEWGPGRPDLAVGQWRPELEALSRREVDAVYVKGALAVEAARGLGAAVVVDLDRFPDRRLRVNNGTPRPITVEQRLLDERPDVVARFLATVLRAAD